METLRERFKLTSHINTCSRSDQTFAAITTVPFGMALQQQIQFDLKALYIVVEQLREAGIQDNEVPEILCPFPGCFQDSHALLHAKRLSYFAASHVIVIWKSSASVDLTLPLE